jgi:hypothetical protein
VDVSTRGRRRGPVCLSISSSDAVSAAHGARDGILNQGTGPMHRSQILAAALSGVVATGIRPLAAQTGFVGVITFVRHDRSGAPDTVVQTSNGHKVRLDGFGSDSGSMIIDSDAKTIIIVEPRKQQYMTMTQDDMTQMQAMMGPMMERMRQKRKAEGKSGSFKFSPTGRSETVAGVKCKVWHGEYVDKDGDKDEGEACVAPGVGFALAELTFANPMMALGDASGAGDMFEQYRDLIGGNKGVLKASKLEKGELRTELEATKVERKPVSDDAFLPPTAFKEVRMGEMMMKAQKAMQRPPQAQ